MSVDIEEIKRRLDWMFQNVANEDAYLMGDALVVINQQQAEIEKLKNQWISVDDRLPKYGEPVLLTINGFVQNIVYVLDGDDDCKDWFEPYHFNANDEDKFFYDKASYWMPLPLPTTTKL